MDCHLQVVSENAIIVEFGNKIAETTLQDIQSVTSYLENHPFPWMVEFVPAFTTITIYFDPLKIWQLAPDYKQLPSQYALEQIELFFSKVQTLKISEPRKITIPVCYGGEFGPDLEFVAKHNNISTDEVINIHANGEYIVYMVGFAPGFPYLGGLSENIFTPRKNTPRLLIPEGSVGIAGGQTGVYPIDSPGGWQIIGQTPLKLFRSDQQIPSLLKMGDRIHFMPISFKEFSNWEAD